MSSLSPGPLPPFQPVFSRRKMLRHTSTGFGMLALSALMADPAYAGLAPSSPKDPLVPKPGHYKPRVRNVIFCYLSGGLSHVDSFDPKPRLDQEAGEPMPFKTERTMFNMDGNIMPSPWKFKRYGSSGIPVSDLFPHIGSVADELTVIRSMTAKFMAHAQANFYFHSGTPFAGFPSMGAWISYGLGSENRNLPGFVVLGSGGIPLGGISIFGNGFLSAVHQGSFIFPERKDPLGNIRPRESGPLQRRKISFINELDREFLAGTAGTLPSRGRHPQLRDRLPDAEFGARIGGPEWRDSGHTQAVRHRFRESGQSGLRPPVPGGSTTGGTRRAFRGAHHGPGRRQGVHEQSLGPARQADRGPQRQRHGSGPTDSGVGQGPQGPGSSGRDPGHLLRRVRPDAVRPGQGRTGPQSLRIQPVAGRRRPQEGVTSTEPPTSTATGWWRTGRPSTICTPPSSTSWVSITRRSATASEAGTSGSPTSTGT